MAEDINVIPVSSLAEAVAFFAGEIEIDHAHGGLESEGLILTFCIFFGWC